MATKTRTTKNGTRVVRKAANDNVPEWRLQAAQVRALRAMPEHGAPNGFLMLAIRTRRDVDRVRKSRPRQLA